MVFRRVFLSTFAAFPSIISTQNQNRPVGLISTDASIVIEKPYVCQEKSVYSSKMDIRAINQVLFYRMWSAISGPMPAIHYLKSSSDLKALLRYAYLLTESHFTWLNPIVSELLSRGLNVCH
jgi:hypothetical protein